MAIRKKIGASAWHKQAIHYITCRSRLSRWLVHLKPSSKTRKNVCTYIIQIIMYKVHTYRDTMQIDNIQQVGLMWSIAYTKINDHFELSSCCQGL